MRRRSERNFSMTIQNRRLSMLSWIRALVDDRFAAFLALEQGEIVFSSERGVERYKIYSAEKRLAMDRYTLRLAVLSRAELEEAFGKMHAEIARRSPRDERLFFNEPFADAEYPHWALQLGWSLEEFAALLLGKDPDIVNLPSLKHLCGSSTFANNFVTLLYRLQQAKERDELRECVGPEELLEWASAHQIIVPLPLAQAVETHSVERNARAPCWGEPGDKKLSGPALTPTERTASAKERDSLTKMVIAMAIDCYGYRPGAPKSSAPQDIVAALVKLGLKLDVGTVRKWLKEGAELLDPQVIKDIATGNG